MNQILKTIISKKIEMRETLYRKRLLILKEEKGLDSNDLAKVLGISSRLYKEYEEHNNIIPIRYLEKIAKLFNVSFDYLLGFSDIKKYNNSGDIDKIKSGVRINSIRKNNLLTLKEFGKILNCSYGTIASYERGKNLISTSVLYDLCKRFNVSSDFILGRIDEDKMEGVIVKSCNDKGYYYCDVLKRLRVKSGLKQKDIANILNIQSGRYSQYETEKEILPIKHLVKIAEYFNVSLDYLFGFNKEALKAKIRYQVDLKLMGIRIKDLRESLKLTQEKFGKKIGSNGSTIAGYEGGVYIIATSLLYNLADKFNISTDYILGLMD